MNYEQSMNNLQVVRKTVADFINAGHILFNDEHLESIDNGISALKTLADMPQKWQLILTCTDEEMEKLMKLHLNSIYGQNVSHETYTKGETTND